MKDIPADVMMTSLNALYAAEKAKQIDVSQCTMPVAIVLASAILAERERCAMIAESTSHRHTGAKSIAAAIRRGDT
jgi:hypothetical protein